MASWFVAYPVPRGSWLARIPPPPEGTRPLNPVDLHLTVAFFGDVGEPRARRSFAWLDADGASPSALEVELTEVIAMGNARRPSALSAVARQAVESKAPLEELLRPLRDGLLEAAGLAPERRALRPHVTLARPRRRAGPEERRRAIAWAEAIELGAPRLRLDRIALYTGADGNSESAYRRVETWALVG